MANVSPGKRGKDGKIHSYYIKVLKYTDENGHQEWWNTTFKVPEGMGEKTAFKKAKEFAAIFEEEMKHGLASSDKTLFKDIAERYINTVERDQKVSTAIRYRELMERINPAIGHTKVTDITPQHLDRLYNKLLQPGENKLDPTKGLSPKTVLEHHRLIHAVLKQAMREGIVKYNVADTVKPPKVTKKESEHFEVEELQEIMKAVENEPLKYKVPLYVMMDTGARRGEVMGLKWENIDLDKGIIDIKIALLYNSKKGVYVDTPKTGKSRLITISPVVVSLLKQLRTEQHLMRMRLGKDWHETGFCFTQANGEPMHPQSIGDWMSKFYKRNNLSHINPHKFRHTQASLLYNQGVDPITISKRLGHAQVSTTQNIYAHLMDKADEKASEVISDAIYTKIKAI